MFGCADKASTCSMFVFLLCFGLLASYESYVHWARSFLLPFLVNLGYWMFISFKDDRTWRKARIIVQVIFLSFKNCNAYTDIHYPFEYL